MTSIEAQNLRPGDYVQWGADRSDIGIVTSTQEHMFKINWNSGLKDWFIYSSRDVERIRVVTNE